MFSRIFIFILIIFCVSCSLMKQKPQLTPYEQFANNLIASIKESSHNQEQYDLRMKDTLSYKVCESEIDNRVLTHPCDCDSSAIRRVFDRVQYRDEKKNIEVKVVTLYYSTFLLNLENPSSLGKDLYSVPSPVIVRKDGSMDAFCGSSNSQTCDYLIVNIQVIKYFDERQGLFFAENHDILIDSEFLNNFSPKDYINYIHRASSKYQENRGLLLYDLCWKENGYSIPCDLDSSVIHELTKFSEQKHSRLANVSYTSFGCGTESFALESFFERSFCESKDGITCDALYFQTISQDKPLLKNYEYNLELKSITSCPVPPASDFSEYLWYYFDEDGNLLSTHNPLP